MRRVLITVALALAVAGVGASATILASGPASATPPRWPDPAAAAPSNRSQLASDVLAARLATAKYAKNLSRAKADGYRIITRMIPNMGYHYMNSEVKGFDVSRPPILVYQHQRRQWQLGALEWVFTTMPAKPPLPGARYGVFGAACHYSDGTLVYATAQSMCATRSPQTGAAFSFWHPRLITLHFWIWYPNSSGLYMGTNPLAAPFNRG
jgi:hypothetical protein